MDQSARLVRFLDGPVEILFLAAPDTIDKVGPVVSAFRGRRARLLLFPQPGAVGLVIFLVRDGHVAFGAVKNVADGVASHIQLLVVPWRANEAGNRFAAEAGSADAGLVVANPVAHFEFQHLALPYTVKLE